MTSHDHIPPQRDTSEPDEEIVSIRDGQLVYGFQPNETIEGLEDFPPFTPMDLDDPYRNKGAEAYRGKDLIHALGRIKEALNIPDGVSVLYPGSATDVSVADAFGKENVTHIDMDKGSMLSLENQGYKAVAGDTREYTPEEKADILVGVNSGEIPDEEGFLRMVKEGGLVVVNNWHHWAHHIQQMPHAELVAAILPDFFSANPEVLLGDSVPTNATELVHQYLTLRHGKLGTGTSEDHDIAGDDARYPDGLFVFKIV